MELKLLSRLRSRKHNIKTLSLLRELFKYIFFENRFPPELCFAFLDVQ